MRGLRGRSLTGAAPEQILLFRAEISQILNFSKQNQRKIDKEFKFLQKVELCNLQLVNSPSINAAVLVIVPVTINFEEN